MALTDNLISYWKCDEASGNLLDAHGLNNLTDTNTVTSASGVIGTSRQFTSANSEYFTIANNASLTVGDIDFTVSSWVYFDDVSNYHEYFSRWATSNSYMISFRLDTERLTFFVYDGSSNDSIAATTFGALSPATWYFVVVWHDSVANTINIEINGTLDSKAHSSGVAAGSGPLNIGARNSGTDHHNGRLDEIGFWKRVLTSGERTSLYNSGAGLAYPFGSGSGNITAWIRA